MANETTQPVETPSERTSVQAETAATDAWIQRTVQAGQQEQTNRRQQQHKRQQKRGRQQHG